MATCSITLAWEIPWTGEPGRLKFKMSQRVGEDLATEQQKHVLEPGLLRWKPGSATYLLCDL